MRTRLTPLLGTTLAAALAAAVAVLACTAPTGPATEPPGVEPDLQETIDAAVIGTMVQGTLEAMGESPGGVQPQLGPSPTPALYPTPATQGPPPEAGPGPTIADCPIFPPDHIWNVRVDTLPVHPRSDEYIESIGADTPLHPDFGAALWEGGVIGLPYNVVSGDEIEAADIEFEYADESDPGPYPIPPDPLMEGGSDQHILIVDSADCRLVEIYRAEQQRGGSWEAGAGAIWDLTGYDLRPETWTSADAAGLPILPGLVRYEEVAAGAINHALRFTAEETQRAYVWPARHFASESTDHALPPMGQRFRLKASFDISDYPPEVQVILRAMQLYGIILADNGTSWYITGSPDERWDDEMLVEAFETIVGSDFEAVDVSGLMIDPNSGQARTGP